MEYIAKSGPFAPTMIVIEYQPATCADGEVRDYTNVYLCCVVGDWNCRKCILHGEHWEPAVQRKIEEAQYLYGIGDFNTLDLRDD